MYRDIDEARAQHAALAEIVERRVPLLKRRILDALELFASRLHSVEALRRTAVRRSRMLERLGDSG